MNILVVASHPDDEVLGCGGTMARLARQGHEVTVLILGEGVTSRFARPQEASRSELEALHRQATEVGALLGVREVVLEGLPDNRFDTLPLLEIVKVVERELERTRAEMVLTQHGGDLNIDHAATFRAVLTATRPLPGGRVREVRAFEVQSSSEWSFQRFAPVFRPDIFVDIAATLDLKLEAMDLYRSEARSFPHPRSREALEAQAKRWGATAGVVAAEAFELIRRVE